jgi:hypothetical protein
LPILAGDDAAAAAEEIIIIIIMSVHAASLCGLFEMAGV